MIYNKAFNLQVCSVTLKKLDGKLYQLWSCLHAGKQWLEMLSLGIRIVFIVANRKYKVGGANDMSRRRNRPAPPLADNPA